LKTAIMQPYFFPYIGYFQLIHSVEQFVIYDDVTYIKNGWINRNRYLLNGQAKFFTLSLNQASSFIPINQTFILDEKYKTKQKILKTFGMAYSKAPFYKTAFGLIEEIIMNTDNNIATYNESSIRKICDYCGIKTSIYVSSKINKNVSLKSQDKVIDICKNLCTSTYVNAPGGRSLYNHEIFNDNGMELKFLRTDLDQITYKQFDFPFVPGLSIIDTLMFNSVEQVRLFLDQYSLEN